MASPVVEGCRLSTCDGLLNFNNEPVLKTGVLYKQGGSCRSWHKRYFVLYGTFLSYYAKRGDSTPKGNIDLTVGLGVRTRYQCDHRIQWPRTASPGLTFGIATEERTYYLYGDNKAIVKEWMTTIQQCIDKIGQPTNDYKNDPEGKPECTNNSSIMKMGAKMAMKVVNMMTRNSTDQYMTEVDEPLMSDHDQDAMEKLEDSDRSKDALRLSDRLKITDDGGSAHNASDHVDMNAGSSVATNLVQDRCDSEAVKTAWDSRLMFGKGGRAKPYKGIKRTGQTKLTATERDENESTKTDRGIGLDAMKVRDNQKNYKFSRAGGIRRRGEDKPNHQATMEETERALFTLVKSTH